MALAAAALLQQSRSPMSQPSLGQPSAEASLNLAMPPAAAAATDGSSSCPSAVDAGTANKMDMVAAFEPTISRDVRARIEAQRQEAGRLFDELDHAGNGYLGIDEFCKGLASCYRRAETSRPIQPVG